MNIEEVHTYCLNVKGSIESFPFGDYSAVFKVMNKIFAILPLDNSGTITLKCNPDYAIELRDKYDGIQPAFHMNKKHWNQVVIERDIKQEILCKLIDHSVKEVIQKLTKKKQQEYERL